MKFFVFIILTTDVKHISMQNNHKKGFLYIIIIFFIINISYEEGFQIYHLTRAFVEII
jgi:hypothetical protein